MACQSLNNTLEDPCLLHNLKGHKKAVTGLSFHPNGRQVASSGYDNSVMLWNISKDIRCYEFKAHSGSVTSVDFASDGQLMASSSEDHTIRLWVPSIKGGSVEIRAHSSAARCVSFSPDNEKLITGSNDKSIKTWNVQRRRFLSSYLGHTHWVRCVHYSPDGSIIASCADDRTLRIWDENSGQCVHTFPSTKGSGNYLAIHRNGKTIALAMTSGSIRVYDVRMQKLQQHYILHNNATCVTWHPYANYLLTSGEDGNIQVVDAMEGRPLYTLKSHEGPIYSVKFSTDGENFASAGADGHVMVWKTNFIMNKAASSVSTSSGSQESV